MRVRTRHEQSWRTGCGAHFRQNGPNMPKSAKSSLLSTEDTHAVQRAVEAALAVVLQERKKKPTTESPPPVSDVEQQIAKAAAGPPSRPASGTASAGRPRHRSLCLTRHGAADRIRNGVSRTPEHQYALNLAQAPRSSSEMDRDRRRAREIPRGRCQTLHRQRPTTTIRASEEGCAKRLAERRACAAAPSSPAASG